MYIAQNDMPIASLTNSDIHKIGVIADWPAMQPPRKKYRRAARRTTGVASGCEKGVIRRDDYLARRRVINSKRMQLRRLFTASQSSAGRKPLDVGDTDVVGISLAESKYVT